MKFPITRKTLIDWGGEQTLRDAQNLVSNGQVLEAEYDPPMVRGSILNNNRALETSGRVVSPSSIENLCPCYTNTERGLICPHIIAVGLILVQRNTDPQREQKYQEEARRAARLEEFKEEAYIQRAGKDDAGSVPATVSISVSDDWLRAPDMRSIPVMCHLVIRGKSIPAGDVPTDVPIALSDKDEAILFVIEDISEGPAKSELKLSHADFINLLRLMKGRSMKTFSGSDLTINDVQMSTVLRMDLDRENGELILIAHTELPFMKPGTFPSYIASGKTGWVYGAGNFWPLSKTLPVPYQPIYHEPIIVPRENVLKFLQLELPNIEKSVPIETDISSDLFTVEPAKPTFRLAVKGSPASLSATLYAQYNGLEFASNKPDAREHFAIPDPNDLMRYTVRNYEAEKSALYFLRGTGFVGECGDDLRSLVGQKDVMNFLGSDLPSLRRHGWKVEIEGRINAFLESADFITPVVHIDDFSDDSWFDVGFDFEDSMGSTISAAEIHTAMRKGESFINRNGSIFLFDTDAVTSMQDVFSDCDSGDSNTPGRFRLSNIYSSFVKSSLDALDGIDVEDPPAWRVKAEKQNRTVNLENVPLSFKLENTLRPYQKEGVNWLKFLEKSGFCGILADEMGLGKTLQTLVWLQMERENREAIGKPSLIICPTSLVDNWAEEAAKFTPDLKTLKITGSDRKDRIGDIGNVDLAITSYAILRRDIDKYLEHDFAVAVLDEAQHIKNKSTQNAQAAKKVQAFNKLVLTGTPIENSVCDLWSIMDFLMPGYMSSHESFKRNYEAPIAKGSRDAEVAQVKLRRKLKPFLLRRLKTDVAKDLPDKIQKIASCTLSPDQRAIYNELLKKSKQKISNMVNKQGFNKSRMEILTILMRLRQVCCHLDLIDLPDLKPAHPSAKMELFFELVNEAVDGGHRILVFSQFVSMLQILRDEMDKKDLAYCYLDGSTKNRQEMVRKFNTQRDIPAFLISLKAGGTGLNLTGADMVIHFDPWWNPSVEDQATDRAHRIGQKRTVYSIKMITKNTVEEKVLSMQQKKKSVIDATIESDEKMISSLSWEDVQGLLEL